MLPTHLLRACTPPADLFSPGVIFYISFILINAFVLINVVIGVLLEKCMVNRDRCSHCNRPRSDK